MTTKVKWTWELFWERATSVLKYIVAVYFILVGLATPWTASVEVQHLGWVYNSKWALITLGLIIAASGLWLLLGKIRKNRRQTGQGLMAVFCCFLFASALNTFAIGTFDYPNLIGALVMGLLYLRWRFKTAYIDPNHFRDDAEELRYNEHHRLAARKRRIPGH